jgi:NAD(P)-dependent dehydrogenase (short-subunit alcohol dehydrogenase family)
MSSSKIWFITGASRGFGRIWAEAALRRGDKVIVTARNTSGFQELNKTYGDSVLALPLDVTDRGAVFQAVREGVDHFGRLDVVLSNAGYGYFGAIEELLPEQVKANFETNVFGTLWVMQAAVPILRAQGGGHIITVSSIGGIMSFPTGGSYNGTKFAVEAISEALAGEVAPFGIRVTILEPGSYSTNFRTAAQAPPPIEAYGPIRQHVRSAFKPEEIGEPAATATAVLEAVDAAQPPLRLVLGSTTISKFKGVYAARISNWEKWETVSNAAQGGDHS